MDRGHRRRWSGLQCRLGQFPRSAIPCCVGATAAVDPVSIDSDDIQALIADLIDTMTAAGGSGIAANQIGVSLAVCVIGVTKNARYPYKPPIPLTVMINPRVQLLDDEQWLNNEGCLSVPLRGDLPRYMNIDVSAFDRNGESFTETYRGLTAGTVQHEVDHLNGRPHRRSHGRLPNDDHVGKLRGARHGLISGADSPRDRPHRAEGGD